MVELFRRLFTVRYAYHDSLQAMRARMILLLSLTSGIVLIVINLLTALDVIGQRDGQVREYALIVLPMAWGISLISAYLIQRGRINYGMALLGIVLMACNLADALFSGSMTTGVIFPMVIIYFSLSFGVRGTVGAYIYAVLALVAMYIIRSNGLFGTEEIDNLTSIVFYSSVNLTITAIMLWLFAGNLQFTFRQSTRIIAQTRATAAIGQALSRMLDLDELLTNAVDLIRDRFALHHVQVFLVDPARSYANLAAGTGETGSTLRAQGFRVPISSRTVAGQTVETGHLCYIEDITQTPYYDPQMLPHTRTELALPLIIGEEVMGVLDIHSARPGAFNQDDIETMRILANQLSQLIHNARLFEAQQQNLLQNRRLFLESETSLREIERLNRQLTGQSWQEYIVERDPDLFSIQITGYDMKAGAADWTPAMRQAAGRRRIVSQTTDGEQILAVPINIRGEAIGAIEVRLSDQQNQAEVRNVVQAVAERMAVSLENIRLFEQARVAVEREQQINRITAQLQGLTSMEDVLATALDALGQALGAEQGSIRLVARDITAHDTEALPMPPAAEDTGPSA
jgi:GAF domain-containing protein